MARGDDLFATIEAIHAAGLDAERWTPALAAITRAVGGIAATFEVYRKQPLRHLECHGFRFPSAAQLEYSEQYLPINERLPFVSRERPGGINWDYQILDERAIERSPFYMEFLPRIDFRYFIDAIVANSEREFAAIVVHRSARQGHVQRDGIATMRRLVPHMRQAFDMARRLKGAGEARSSLECALDWLADGVALVRADRTIVYANEAFQVIARRNDGIGARKGALEFTLADSRTRLDAAVGNIGRFRSGDLHHNGAADFHVPRKLGAPPYLVSVRPLLDNKHAGNGAVAIVFVRDPMVRSVAGLRILREILGLTEAEAALAQALQSGMSLADYAKADAVSLNTVYTHLRRIKEKTGCHRMAELIRKLNDLQVPLRVV